MGYGEGILILGHGIDTRSQKMKSFFLAELSLLYRLIIPICYLVDQLRIRNRSPFNKTKTVETVRNSTVN